MFNGKPYQCNPKLSGPKKGPCCSPSGFCGNTDAHCACDTCVDFSKEQAGANADESKDATDGKASTEEDESSDADGPDLEAECEAASEAGEDQHSEYCELDCTHTMCKYPVC